MAIIDSFDIFADKQIVNDTCYSAIPPKDLGAPMDWGQTVIQKYIELVFHGAFTHPLTVQLIGFNNKNASDQFVICATPEIPITELIKGSKKFLQIPPIGKKYRFVILKFMPTGGSSGSATAAKITGGQEVTDVSALKAVSDGSFKITVDGSEITATGIDLTGQSDGSGIATVLTGKMNSKATVTFADNRFVVTSKTTGKTSTISVMSSDGSGTDISGLLYLNEGSVPTIIQGQDAISVSEGGGLCPVDPVDPPNKDNIEEIPNCLSAYLTLTPDYNTLYKAVNSDKETA